MADLVREPVGQLPVYREPPSYANLLFVGMGDAVVQAIGAEVRDHPREAAEFVVTRKERGR